MCIACSLVDFVDGRSEIVVIEEVIMKAMLLASSDPDILARMCGKHSVSFAAVAFSFLKFLEKKEQQKVHKSADADAACEDLINRHFVKKEEA